MDKVNYVDMVDRSNKVGKEDMVDKVDTEHSNFISWS